MIFDILFLVFGAFLAMLRGLFTLLSMPVPPEVVETLSYFVGKLVYVAGILNVSDILAAAGWFLTFTTSWYTIKLILWALSFIPWFGKNVSPKI